MHLRSEQICKDYSSTHKGDNRRKRGGKKTLGRLKKKKFTSVTSPYLDVTIWDHMANVRRESVLNYLSYV